MLTLYKMWQTHVDNLPRKSRYTLGSKIDNVFLNILELLFTAQYQPLQEKVTTLRVAVHRFDILKFLLRVAWEIHAIDTSLYTHLSTKADEVGKMLGGWYKGVATKTPPRK